MALFTDDVYAEVSGSGQSRYLNVSKIPKDKPARIAILQEPAFTFYEIWGENISNSEQVKPFRFSRKPKESEILTLMGGDYRVREVNPEWADVPGELEKPKRVFAFTVWNYASGQLEIMSVKQISIIKGLADLTKTEEYADLTGWDLNVARVSQTQYSVTHLPRKKGTESEVENALTDAQASGFDVTRMIENGDPFTEG